MAIVFDDVSGYWYRLITPAPTPDYCKDAGISYSDFHLVPSQVIVEDQLPPFFWGFRNEAVPYGGNGNFRVTKGNFLASDYGVHSVAVSSKEHETEIFIVPFIPSSR